MPPKRPAIDVDRLLADLVPVWVSPNSFTYAEKLDADLDSDKLVSGADILKIFAAHNKRLCYRQSDLVPVFQKLGETRNSKWRLEPRELAEWAQVAARRVRTALRHRAHASIKPRVTYCPTYASSTW